MITYFEKQDLFKKEMLKDYEDGRIHQSFVFKPYFDWKQGKRKCDFKLQELREMRRAARSMLNRYDKRYPGAWENADYSESDNIFKPYEGYGPDTRNVAYVLAIEEELTNLLILRMD